MHTVYINQTPVIPLADSWSYLYTYLQMFYLQNLEVLLFVRFFFSLLLTF